LEIPFYGGWKYCSSLVLLKRCRAAVEEVLPAMLTAV
jgi:hypothetical protein